MVISSLHIVKCIHFHALFCFSCSYRNSKRSHCNTYIIKLINCRYSKFLSWMSKGTLIRKSEDYVYGIWVYKVPGIWKGMLTHCYLYQSKEQLPNNPVDCHATANAYDFEKSCPICYDAIIMESCFSEVLFSSYIRSVNASSPNRQLDIDSDETNCLNITVLTDMMPGHDKLNNQMHHYIGCDVWHYR